MQSIIITFLIKFCENFTEIKFNISKNFTMNFKKKKMLSISSLLSDSPTANNNKPFSRTSSSSPPVFHSQFQKVIQTSRPTLSATNSYNSALSTSPNLSESSNDEQNGIIHQTFTNGFQAYDNPDTKISNNIYQKLHFQTVQILHHDFIPSCTLNKSYGQFLNDSIPPLLLNKSNSQNSINKDNQNSADSNKSIITPVLDMKIPDPTYYDKDGMKYGIRCVCGDPHDDGFLVQCEKCEMWLHGTCINYARNAKCDHFYCPFCLKTKIQCVCGKSMYYDIPLIQCQKCGNWSHKSCENIEYGIIPSDFICTNCRKLNQSRNEINQKVFYKIPYVKFCEQDKDVINITVFTSNCEFPFDKSSIIASLPDGPFRNMIEEDLNFPELNFRSFMEKYFHTFAPLFFDRIHEFFRVFNETVCAIFRINKKSVLRALDVLANRLLYNQSQAKNYNDYIENHDQTIIKKEILDKSINNDEIDDDCEEEDLSYSESITDYLKELQTPRLENFPNSVELYTDSERARSNFDSNSITKKNRRKRRKNENENNDENNNSTLNDHLSPSDLDIRGGVYTPTSLEDGAFITEIPGFIFHTDEIKADSGLPYTSILVTDDVLFVDALETPFQDFSRKLRRSFHFNCIVKMIRVQGTLHAALFATKLQGPLSEEKSRRGDAIPANGELILPFDGHIPYPTEKVEWKERRRRKFNIGMTISDPTDSFHKFENPGLTNISPPILDLTKNFNNNNNSNNNDHNSCDNNHEETTKKTKKKITQQTVAKRCAIDPNLTLLSTFIDGSVPPMPFIILSDEEDIDVYKTQMERIKSRILSQ